MTISGIEKRLARTAYRPILTMTHCDVADLQDEVRALQLLLDRRIDGLIVLAGRLPDSELRAIAVQLPVVVVARRVEGLDRQCLYVDNEAGAYRATRYLIGLGHRRIAHLTGTPGHPDATARLVGYRRALEEAGLSVDERLIIEGHFTEDSGLAGVEELLVRGDRFTAIFAANDQSAYGVMLGLFNHDYRIPADVSVVSFDDQPVSSYTLPPLTTVRLPVVKMGEAAVEGLLRMLDGDKPVLPRFTTDLIIRKSATHARHGD